MRNGAEEAVRRTGVGHADFEQRAVRRVEQFILTKPKIRCFWLKSNIFQSDSWALMASLFHYTDRDGWNAIRAQVAWLFRALQPPSPERPVGAYFTDIRPSKASLRSLAIDLGIPKSKFEYVFEFTDLGDMVQLNDGRGRDQWIFLSDSDYQVTPERQLYSGLTSEYLGAET